MFLAASVFRFAPLGVLVATLAAVTGANAQKVDLEALAKSPIDAVVVFPPTDRLFTASEHPEGQLAWLGDANGVDVVVNTLVEEDGRMWSRPYRNDGLENEDWFGWKAPVFAPIDGKVVAINVNTTVNRPGVMTPGRATFVVIEGKDETNVMVAHLRELRVAKGDDVKAGQQLGVIGNNGFSRHPHIHMGAWRGQTPLQIRFDLRAMGQHYKERILKDQKNKPAAVKKSNAKAPTKKSRQP